MHWKPITEKEFQRQLNLLEPFGKLGGFYINNTKILIQMLKQKKLKPSMPEKKDDSDG
jgi:hypothetical protein